MQSVSKMAALERTDMLRWLRQLIEMPRCANFSENTSLRGNVVIQRGTLCEYTNLYCIAEARSHQCLKQQFPR